MKKPIKERPVHPGRLNPKRSIYDERGVSPVIAVILMVAITVVLAAVLYVMVSGILDPIGITPKVSMNWEEEDVMAGNYTGYLVSISSDSSINTDDVTVTISHGGSSGAESLNAITTSTPLTVGTLNLYFDDQAPKGKLGAEDIFSLDNGETSDLFRLVHKPTKGQMVSIKLP
jgi:flagellin-like protein